MDVLITTDLHLTDNEADKYRWEIFRFLRQTIKEYKPKELYILGDLTEKKDRHTSSLVNRLIDELAGLSSILPIIILQGNHDYINRDSPFFRFLSKMPNIRYILDPTKIGRCLFIPHLQGSDLKLFDYNFADYEVVFMHQTVMGAKVGLHIMEGVDPSNFATKVYSGDVHVPQQVGNVTYIGAPYPIDFGDDYAGRLVLLTKNHGDTFIVVPSIRKVSLKIPFLGLEQLSLSLKEKIFDYCSIEGAGNQYKVEIHFHKTDYDKWPVAREMVKKAIKERHAILSSIKMIPEKEITLRKRLEKTIEKDEKELIRSFAKIEGLNSRYVKIAEELVRSLKEDSRVIKTV